MDARRDSVAVNQFFDKVLEDIDFNPLTVRNEFYDLLEVRIRYANQKSRGCFHFYIPNQVGTTLRQVEDMLDDYGDLIIAAGIPSMETTPLMPNGTPENLSMLQVSWPQMEKGTITVVRNSFQYDKWVIDMDEDDKAQGLNYAMMQRAKILAGLQRDINKESPEPQISLEDIACIFVVEPDANRRHYSGRFHVIVKPNVLGTPFSIEYTIHSPSNSLLVDKTLTDTINIDTKEPVYFSIRTPPFYTIGDPTGNDNGEYVVGMKLTTLHDKPEKNQVWPKKEYFTMKVGGIVPQEDAIVLDSTGKPNVFGAVSGDTLYLQVPTHFISSDTTIKMPVTDSLGNYRCIGEFTFSPQEKPTEGKVITEMYLFSSTRIEDAYRNFKRLKINIAKENVAIKDTIWQHVDNKGRIYSTVRDSSGTLNTYADFTLHLPWDNDGTVLDSLGNEVRKTGGKVPEKYVVNVPANSEGTLFKPDTLDVPGYVRDVLKDGYDAEQKAKKQKDKETRYVSTVSFAVQKPYTTLTLAVPLPKGMPKGDYTVTGDIMPVTPRMYSNTSIPYQRIIFDRIKIE